MKVSRKKIQFHIGGMTCVNCQNKIERQLKRTQGIIRAKVSYNNGVADIVYNNTKLSKKQIIAIIENLGYKVLLGKEQERTDMKKMICTLVIIVSLYIILQSMGILNLLVPSQLADVKMGYGMLFVLGLITSVHCIAMCGGINLSQCIPQKKIADNTSKLDVFRLSFFYNLGRVLSYTAVGFALGAVGMLIGGDREVGLSTVLQGILKIIAGVFMVIMGVNMLGLFPWLRKFTIRMPRFLVRKIGKEKAKSSRPFLVGILNGFMPCGPLQSMWIVALATGNPFSGALSMFLFSLGTVPLMFGLGTIVSALGRKFTDKVMTIGAILVIVLGLAMLSQGGSLSGWIPPDLLLALVIAFSISGIFLSIPVHEKTSKNLLRIASLTIIFGAYILWNVQGIFVQNSSAVNAEAKVVDDVQEVNSTLAAGRYPNITVQAGVPVKWVIDASESSINGCNYKMMIQDYGIEYTFHTGENVIEFTPTKTGTVRYSCWMGMIHGNIFVTDGNEDDSNTAESGDEADVPTLAEYTIPTDTIKLASLITDENGNEIQDVNIELTDEGFSPAIIVVQSDLTVNWNIDNKMTDAGNGIDLLAPYYSTKLSLGEGVNQLSLYPSESFDVSTGDNRFYCYVKVVDDLNEVDEDAIREEVASFQPLIYPVDVFESSGMSCCGS